jgi:hypothetical protein
MNEDKLTEALDDNLALWSISIAPLKGDSIILIRRSAVRQIAREIILELEPESVLKVPF